MVAVNEVCLSVRRLWVRLPVSAGACRGGRCLRGVPGTAKGRGLRAAALGWPERVPGRGRPVGSAVLVGHQRDAHVVHDERREGERVEDLVEAEPAGEGLGRLIP